MNELKQIMFDSALIVACIYAGINFDWFLGGWGWFLLLGLSPRAHGG